MKDFPSNQEIQFKKRRKALTAKLTAVIMSLSTKLNSTAKQQLTRQYLDVLQPGPIIDDLGRLPYYTPKTPYCPEQDKTLCLWAEIDYAVVQFWEFVNQGDPKKANIIEGDIERLEWIRDNWDDLVPVGSLKDGFLLTRKI